MPYSAQRIAITRSLNTAGCPSGTLGEQSGAGADQKCQCVHSVKKLQKVRQVAGVLFERLWTTRQLTYWLYTQLGRK